MKINLLKLALLCSVLSGCCYFFPCHPGTWLIGSVSDVNNVPVPNADVILYGAKTVTDKRGCFNIHLPDAIPFTFVVSSSGYKSIEMKASPGFYRIEAKLNSTEAQENSHAKWMPITESEYNSTGVCGS